MNYYEVYLPDHDEPCILNAVRKLRNLPEGTIIWRNMESERYEVPVVNGKPEIKRRS